MDLHTTIQQVPPKMQRTITHDFKRSVREILLLAAIPLRQYHYKNLHGQTPYIHYSRLGHIPAQYTKNKVRSHKIAYTVQLVDVQSSAFIICTY